MSADTIKIFNGKASSLLSPYTWSIQEDTLFQELLQSISFGQIDSILKEDIKIFARLKS